MTLHRLGLLAILIATWGWVAPGPASAAAIQNEHWVATWAVALQGDPPPKITVKNQTIRQVLRISVGGPRLRVWLSNEYGTKPLMIGAASVAIANPDGTVRPNTFAKITFDGSSRVRIPPGVRVMSDAIELKTDALQSLAVNLYFPDETPLATFHSEDVSGSSPRANLASGATISTAGDFTAAVALPVQTQEPNTHVYPPFLNAIDTVAPPSTPVIVCLCDTKSEGPGFWPNYLIERLAPRGIAFANMAQYAGTLTLYQPYGTALTRFDRDVLGISGATHVILFNTSNDINMPGMNNRRHEDRLADEDIKLGVNQVVKRAHTAGLKVIGATMVPFEGVLRPGYSTPEHLQRRNEFNQWMRTSGVFDALIDFDAAVRDPGHPERILPSLDVGNHFTPSDAGHRAMADSIDIKLFQ